MSHPTSTTDEATPPIADVPTVAATRAGDRVTRAITYDGGFRVMACRTTELVREAVRLQKLEGLDARIFGELLTGAILVRETMAPGHRVQAILTREGVGSIVADSHPPGDGDLAATRGLLTRQSRGDGLAGTAPLLGSGAILKVMRTLPRGRLHQSIVDAQPPDLEKPASMAESLMRYMHDSEQVFATLGVATVVDGARVVASGGFVVQLLPELAEGPLAVMTERLNHDFRDLDPLVVQHDGDLSGWLMRELLHGMSHEVLADSPLAWGCDCSMARVLGAIATLGRDDLQSMVLRGEVVDLTCEYCTKAYHVGPEQIRSLLDPA